MPKPVVVTLQVNGREVAATVDPRTSLVAFLREHLFLTGTRVGCDTAQCGACTVLMDGKAIKSCNVLLAQAHARRVTTIEGLGDGRGGLHPLQECFSRHHALQCGYCTSGMVMRACELMSSLEEMSEDAIREALDGNLCRCTGYYNIVAAVKEALSLRAQEQSPAAHEDIDRVSV